MLNKLITSKNPVAPAYQIFCKSGNRGYLNGLASEFNESTNSIRKELNHLSNAGYLEKKRQQ